MSYSFVKISPTDSQWAVIESTYDSTVDKTKEWLCYLESIGCESFICEVYDNNVLIGYFVGEILRRFGIRILGSPFEGISTAHQGLSMLRCVLPSVRLAIYRELSKWVFHHKYAFWIQIEDWQLSMEDVEESGIMVEGHDTSWVDLTCDEETIFHQFSQKSCRYMINKALRSGVTIRETVNPSMFIETHFSQHQEVMYRKGLDVLKPKETFEKLIKAVYPTKLLLLEAVSAEGDIISTAIFSVGGQNSRFISRASYQKDLHYSPNELIMWEGMKICKSFGAEFFNNSGVGSFKMKFGSKRCYKPRLIFSKYKFLIPLRKMAASAIRSIRFKISKLGIFISK